MSTYRMWSVHVLSAEPGETNWTSLSDLCRYMCQLLEASFKSNDCHGIVGCDINSHLTYAMWISHPTHHQTKVLVAHEAFHSSEGSLSTPRVGGPSKCNQERVDPPSPQIQCSFASDSSDSALVHPHIKGRHLLHVTRHRAQCQVLFPSIQDPVKTCQGQRIDFSGFAPHR